MSTRIYVGNLAWGTTENEMQEIFAHHGPVHEIQLSIDKPTGDFRGFGFVTMNDEEAAERAIKALNGTIFHGQFIKVVGNRHGRNRPLRGKITRGDHVGDETGPRQADPGSSATVELLIRRLEERSMRMTQQMRKFVLSLCGATAEGGDIILRRIFRLRKRMVVTRRRIRNLQFQDRARN